MRDAGPRCAAYAAAYRDAWATARQRHYPGPAVARYAGLHAASTVHATCTPACLTPTPMKEHPMTLTRDTWARHGKPDAPFAYYGTDAGASPSGLLVAKVTVERRTVRLFDGAGRELAMFNITAKSWLGPADGPDVVDTTNLPSSERSKALGTYEPVAEYDPEPAFDATVGGADTATELAELAAEEAAEIAAEQAAAERDTPVLAAAARAQAADEPAPVDAFVSDLQAAGSDAELLAAYDGYLQRVTVDEFVTDVQRATVPPARYQVRGPHSSARDAARWTVVDTRDRDIAVDTCRRREDAQAVARELNSQPPTAEEIEATRQAVTAQLAAGDPDLARGAMVGATNMAARTGTRSVLTEAARQATLRSVRVGRRAQAALAAQQANPLAAEVLAAMEGATFRASGACSVRVSPAAAELVRSLGAR